MHYHLLSLEPMTSKYYFFHYYSTVYNLFYRVAVCMHSAVLITTRPIFSGEELLLDYRLNPSMPYPDWYVPFNEEASKRRWYL
jgi:hypothetical protein